MNPVDQQIIRNQNLQSMEFDQVPSYHTNLAGGAIPDRTKAGHIYSSFFRLARQLIETMDVKTLNKPDPLDPTTWYYSGDLKIAHGIKSGIPIVDMTTIDYNGAETSAPKVDDTFIYLKAVSVTSISINVSFFISEILNK